MYYFISIYYFIFLKKNTNNSDIYRYSEFSFKNIQLNNLTVFLLNTIFLNARRYAFFFNYNIFKLYFNKNKVFNKDVIIYFLKNLLIRYLIIIITGLPYLFLKKNIDLVKNIHHIFSVFYLFDLEGKNLFGKIQLFVVVLLQDITIKWDFSYYDLSNNIAIIKKEDDIIFNPKNEKPGFLSTLLKPSFFNNLKNSFIFNNNNRFTYVNLLNKFNNQRHLSAIYSDKKNNKVYFVNETSTEYLPKDLFEKDYIQNLDKTLYNKNILIGPGTIDKTKNVFLTPIQSFNKNDNIISIQPLTLNQEEVFNNNIYSFRRMDFHFWSQANKMILEYTKDNKIIIDHVSFESKLNSDQIDMNLSQKQSTLNMIAVFKDIEKNKIIYKNFSPEEKINFIKSLPIRKDDRIFIWQFLNWHFFE